MPFHRNSARQTPFTERERLADSLRKAFPVPDCGSFAGLLNAIGDADRRLRA
jgi:hypothetical protein